MITTGQNLDRYLTVRPQMKSCDCLLWESNSILGWAIRLISKKYNHAALILNEFEDLTNHKYILEALEHGIVLSQIGRRLEHYNGKVYWLKAKPEYDYLRKDAAIWAIQQVGVPYDYGSLFKNLFSRVSADASKLFCSEFVYIAWKYAYLKNGGESDNGKVFNLGKAPVPADMPKMGIWEDPVRIF